eukprot:2063414-Amphidinium_carterae.1
MAMGCSRQPFRIHSLIKSRERESHRGHHVKQIDYHSKPTPMHQRDFAKEDFLKPQAKTILPMALNQNRRLTILSGWNQECISTDTTCSVCSHAVVSQWIVTFLQRVPGDH